MALREAERYEECVAAWERADDAAADLNLLDFYDADAPRTVLERVARRQFVTPYDHAWSLRYTAFAHLDLGDAAQAEQALRAILDRYGASHRTLVADTREGLEEYIEDERPGSATAREFMRWFKA